MMNAFRWQKLKHNIETVYHGLQKGYNYQLNTKIRYIVPLLNIPQNTT